MSENSSGARWGAILLVVALAAVAYLFLSRGGMRNPRDGELLLVGRVARGPGGDCWILNAENGERYNFFGDELAGAQKVGAKVKMLVTPEMDKISPCNQGRVVTVVQFRVLEEPNYGKSAGR